MASFSRRDNFTKSVIEILYKRAGGKCCRCEAATFGPFKNNPNKYVNIGQAAHIAAAASGGPRYDAKMSPEQRSSATNGLWLCSNCHDVVDRDVAKYTKKVLLEMRKKREEQARKEVGVASQDTTGTDASDVLDAGISAAAIVEIRKAKATLLPFYGKKLTTDEGEDLLDAVNFIDFSADSYLPPVGKELLVYLVKLTACCDAESVTMEVIRRMKQIADVFHAHWNNEEVELISETMHGMVEAFTTKRKRIKHSPVAQSALACLKDLSSYTVLREKKLDTGPKELLKSLRQGKDETDMGPLKKRVRVAADSGGSDAPPPPEEEGEDDYLALMEQLAEAGDETVLQLESKVAELGYESNIL